MDLLNQSLNSFSGQISDLSIGLNLDIFETNTEQKSKFHLAQL